MAGHSPLNRRPRGRLLALAALVLLAHVAALHLLSRWLAPAGALKPMVAPLYTRLLQPQEPPEPPPVAVRAGPAAEPAPPPGRMRATPSVPRRNTPTVAEAPPQEPPVASAPALPEPQPMVEPPAPAASDVAQAPDTPEPPAPAAAASTPGGGTATVAAASVDAWPADTRLRYQLGGRFRSGDLYGDARVLWQREGARYQVRVEVDVPPFASFVMTSQGDVSADALVPRAYEEIRNGKPRGLLRMGEREVQLLNGKVVARPSGMQDTASQFVDLSHRFGSGLERLEVGNAISFWMARPGAVDLWTYDVVGSEVLRTKLGEVEAFHLKPRPIANPRGNITAEMWFAPTLQYLPVRIRVTMSDEAHVDLLVEAIEQR